MRLEASFLRLHFDVKNNSFILVYTDKVTLAQYSRRYDFTGIR